MPVVPLSRSLSLPSPLPPTQVSLCLLGSSSSVQPPSKLPKLCFYAFLTIRSYWLLSQEQIVSWFYPLDAVVLKIKFPFPRKTPTHAQHPTTPICSGDVCLLTEKHFSRMWVLRTTLATEAHVDNSTLLPGFSAKLAPWAQVLG